MQERFMQKRTYLELPTEVGYKFYYRKEALEEIYYELEEFLEFVKSLNSLDYAKKVLFSHELKANNLVEGYSDDLESIERIIQEKCERIKDEKQKRRILNLYEGYKFILRNHVLDERHLYLLYSILSDGLITDDYSIKFMGDLYRENSVKILRLGRIEDNPNMGVDASKISSLMQYYFNFINNTSTESMTDEYIKSQIMHFYFVYIHPYFDVNGKTSRTMALWYLLNKGAYPFIIFNRGISISGVKYDNLIREAKDSADITYFLKFMLETVKCELEKELVIQHLVKDKGEGFSSIDYEIMLYFLSIDRAITLGDFAAYYNRLNDKKPVPVIYEEMVKPLIDKDIVIVLRYTKKYFGDVPNMELEINKELVPCGEEMHLKRLKSFQSSKK